MNHEIERYAQGDSPLHRWDARWKLGAFLLLAASCASLSTLEGAGTALLTAIIALVLSRLPLRLTAVRMGEIHLFLIPCFLVLPFTATGPTATFEGIRFSIEGLDMAAMLYLRALSIVMLSIALIYTTPMSRLMQAAESLYFPRTLVQIALLTYRYLFTLAEEFQRIRCALRVRAFRNEMTMHAYRVWANVAGMTLARSLERTERVHNAMKCRGYDGCLKTLKPFQAKVSDMNLFALAIIAAGVAVAVDWAAKGWISI